MTKKVKDFVVRTFQLTPGDFKWLQSIKKKANGVLLGTISLSHVLRDVIRFARENGYDAQWDDDK